MKMGRPQGSYRSAATATCVQCDGAFQTGSWARMAKYCSKRCGFQAYYKRNPERWHKYTRPPQAEQPWWRDMDVFDQRAVVLHKRVSKKREVSDVTGAALRHMMDEQLGLCVLCGGNIRTAWEVDHIVPRADGGITTPGNIQLLCRRCNKGKWTFSQEEYIKHCTRVAAHAAAKGASL